jgi:hypothetical protein
MSWLEFTSSVVHALAWPAAVFAIVLILRRPLRALILSLRILKYKDLQAEFGRKVDEAEDLAAQAKLPPAEEATPEAEVAPTSLESLAEVAPRQAIIEAWIVVNRELRLVAQRAGLHVPPGRSPRQVARDLQRRGILRDEVVALLADLNGLRNTAAHVEDFSIPPEQAIRFVEIAERLTEQLKELP